MSDVYPGHNGMVGSVIIMLVVVYLSTNQGGVFEYDPLVSTVDFTCTDGPFGSRRYICESENIALWLQLHLQVRNTCSYYCTINYWYCYQLGICVI